MKNLSIITVCLNAENVMEKTIQSVLNQSYTDYEYIIIDGGSVDNTSEIIKKYTNSISFIVSEPDTGIFNAQNKGIRLAQGKYLLFLNSGDYLCNSTVLERVFQLPHSEDLLYGDIIFTNNKKQFYKVKSPRRITVAFMLRESLPHPSTFISYKLIERIGIYDERYRICADYDFFMKAIFEYNCKIKYLPLPITVFNLEGISSKLERTLLYKSERRRIQRHYLNKSTLTNYEMFKLFYIVFKKLKYILYFIRSLIDAPHLKNELIPLIIIFSICEKL